MTGDVPNQNWGKGVWREGCEALNGRVMAETILVPHAACQGCFIRCARWIKIEKGPYAMDGPGPEYETRGGLRHHAHERRPRGGLLGQRPVQPLR